MTSKTIKIKKGLDLPISGKPAQEIQPGNRVSSVALLGDDSVGLRPHFAVETGDRVKTGQVLYIDKKRPSIRYTSPGSGKVKSINRGEKRVFKSIVIELEEEDPLQFKSCPENRLSSLDSETIQSLLLETGLWTAIRSRPFNCVADPGIAPHSIFVTAMDTNPLAPLVSKILEGKESFFKQGLTILSRLTEGNVYVCRSPDETIPRVDLKNVSEVEFKGKHPAGNPGTHIHFLDPVHRQKNVWFIGAQDVACMGELFVTGRINTERIISLSGPEVKNPRLIRTRIGASIEDLTRGELKSGFRRIISGSVFHGHISEELTPYLGRYHQQITVLPETHYRRFFGWLSPGFDLYSVKNIVASRLIPKKTFSFTTALHGGMRSIVPIGSYEKVMPLDILPNYLLRALAVDDIDESEKLGCLELDEEDLALCTFVCPAKINHGENLRRVLNLIEKEG